MVRFSLFARVHFILHAGGLSLFTDVNSTECDSVQLQLCTCPVLSCQSNVLAVDRCIVDIRVLLPRDRFGGFART